MCTFYTGKRQFHPSVGPYTNALFSFFEVDSVMEKCLYIIVDHVHQNGITLSLPVELIYPFTHTKNILI